MVEAGEEYLACRCAQFEGDRSSLLYSLDGANDFVCPGLFDEYSRSGMFSFGAVMFIACVFEKVSKVRPRVCFCQESNVYLVYLQV